MELTLRLLPIFVIFLSSSALAAIRTASSCSRDDVYAAMQLAEAGDTVSIPACTGESAGEWASAITWTAPANVTLKGAGSLGTVGGGDATVIIDNLASNAILLKITVNATGVFRFCGITIEGSSDGVTKDNGVLQFVGPGTVRIDHCHFDTTTYTQPSPARQQKIPVLGNGIYGVIDHCILDLYGASAPYVLNGSGDDTKGNIVWTEATGFGGDDFIFFEDNQYNGYATSGETSECRASDGWSAGREVFRYNDLFNCTGPEEHGTGHAGDDRGFRAIEYYGNTSTADDGSLKVKNGPGYKMVSVQTGGALIWGNDAVACYKNGVVFNVTRKNNSTYSQTATPYGWGYCGTDFNGTGSNWDKNDVAATGTPCVDQPGRGPGDLLTGVFADGSKINSTTKSISWPNQALEPVYMFDNDISIVSGWGGYLLNNGTCTEGGCRLATNVDYYEQASGVQVSSSSPFDGTAGAGWGTLANRPTTCTAGVAYWASDQGGNWNRSNADANDGALYKCTATDTWTLYYTPYSYPHPLTNYSCDINADGDVDDADLSLLADVILGLESSAKGDVNYDGNKNILDLMQLISVTLGRTTCP